jgi:hypothetical protein
MSSSSYSSFCRLAARNSLTLVSIGASRAEPFTPSNLSLFQSIGHFVQISVSTKSCPTTNHRHGRLLRVKRHGSSHHHRPDLVRHRLLGTETYFNDWVQEQVLRRSAMKTLPLLHNLRVCPEQSLPLCSILKVTRSRPCHR